MITPEGYSKEKGLPAEGVAVTFGQEMMNDQGGMRTFLRAFISSMEGHEDGEYWMHKCTNLPKVEVDIVYIIVAGRLWAKAYCGGYRIANPYRQITDEMDEELEFAQENCGYTADGIKKIIDWNHIILSGPLERCPFKRTLKGFRGFRYTTKLF